MKIVWSPLAIDRVSEIANYIARDKPSAPDLGQRAALTGESATANAELSLRLNSALCDFYLVKNLKNTPRSMK